MKRLWDVLLMSTHKKKNIVWSLFLARANTSKLKFLRSEIDK